MRFLETIDNSFIGRIIQSKLNILEHTDPNRIYVENIRSFYNIPFPVAKFFCELAVKRGYFTKWYAAKCPNDDNILIAVDNKNKFPKVVVCDICQALERDEYEFNIDRCPKSEFYKLNVQ